MSMDLGQARTYGARELLRSPGVLLKTNSSLGESPCRQRIFKQGSICIQQVFIELSRCARRHAGQKVAHDGRGPYSHGAYMLVQKTIKQAIKYKCDVCYKTGDNKSLVVHMLVEQLHLVRKSENSSRMSIKGKHGVE